MSAAPGRQLRYEPSAFDFLVPAEGIEPPTFGLQIIGSSPSSNRRSAANAQFQSRQCLKHNAISRLIVSHAFPVFPYHTLCLLQDVCMVVCMGL
jgi:hypothetical protein